MHHFRIDLEPDEAAPFRASQPFREWLDTFSCSSDVCSDAVLVLAELVDNAVAHAGTPAIVVAVFDDGRLRIEVHDADVRPPTLMDPTPSGGFGLRIVEATCDDWGWAATDYGKRVWAELLC